MLLTLTATATPTPSPLAVAEPSATACPSTLALDCTVTVPVAVTVRLSGIEAIDDPFSMLTAIAPATLTDPSPLDAEGAVAPLVPLALGSFDVAVVLAKSI